MVQDASYPHLITLIERAIGRVHGGSGRVGTFSKVGCVEIYAYWQHWPCSFPNMGGDGSTAAPLPWSRGRPAS